MICVFSIWNRIEHADWFEAFNGFSWSVGAVIWRWMPQRRHRCSSDVHRTQINGKRKFKAMLFVFVAAAMQMCTVWQPRRLTDVILSAFIISDGCRQPHAPLPHSTCDLPIRSYRCISTCNTEVFWMSRQTRMETKGAKCCSEEGGMILSSF